MTLLAYVQSAAQGFAGKACVRLLLKSAERPKGAAAAAALCESCLAHAAQHAEHTEGGLPLPEWALRIQVRVHGPL